MIAMMLELNTGSILERGICGTGMTLMLKVAGWDDIGGKRGHTERPKAVCWSKGLCVCMSTEGRRGYCLHEECNRSWANRRT